MVLRGLISLVLSTDQINNDSALPSAIKGSNIAPYACMAIIDFG